MLNLDDTGWKDLRGGYGVPYDVSVALRSMQRGNDVWEELWDELHHQGDIGDASYAAVPQLVSIAGAAESRDWNFMGCWRSLKLRAIEKEIRPSRRGYNRVTTTLGFVRPKLRLWTCVQPRTASPFG
jgi:hypothetical protein